MKKCKLCNEPLLECEVWQHLISTHKKELMEQIEPMKMQCCKCGVEFIAQPEPILRKGDLAWMTAAICHDCSGYFYGFVVDFVEPKLKGRKK